MATAAGRQAIKSQLHPDMQVGCDITSDSAVSNSLDSFVTISGIPRIPRAMTQGIRNEVHGNHAVPVDTMLENEQCGGEMSEQDSLYVRQNGMIIKKMR